MPSPWDRSAIVQILPFVITVVMLWLFWRGGAAAPEDRGSRLRRQPHSGSKEQTGGHCRLGHAPAGCPRRAVLLVIIRLHQLLYDHQIVLFSCKHFHFLLGSQYPVELSKEYTEPPLYVGDGTVDRPVRGTELLLREGTRPSYCVRLALNPAVLLSALHLGSFPNGNKMKWKTRQK